MVQSRLIFDSNLPRGFGSDDATLQISEHPDVWTDGSLVLDEVSGASSSGSGSILTFLELDGVRVGGVMLKNLVLQVVWVTRVEVFALCWVLLRLFRELSLGREEGYSCLASVPSCSLVS